MKIKFHQTARRLKSTFKTLILLVICLGASENLEAQSKKVYEKEMPVAKGVTIETNVPTDLGFEMHGTMVNDNTKDRYIVSGKNGDQRLNISKELNIHTWDKQSIKQEVTIDAHLEDNASAKALLESLKIEFNGNANGHVVIDANMNIKKFRMNNGFLKSDECYIVLDNGRKHKINRIEIKTVLYIPKGANLSIEGKRNCTILLDDLEGDLELILSYAEVYGKSVNRVKGNLNYCYNVIFENVNHAEINAINSHIEIASVKHLEVGKQKISNRCLAPSVQKYMKSNSFQNVFNIDKVEQLSVLETANDEFNLKEVFIMDVLESAYSQYRIDVLHNVLNFSAKNSDLKIMKVAKGFREINLNNTLSEIYLDVEDGASYMLNIPSKNYLEYDLNQKFKAIENASGSLKSYEVGEGKQKGVIYINCDKCQFNIS